MKCNRHLKAFLKIVAAGLGTEPKD